MPATEFPKLRPHPIRSEREQTSSPIRATSHAFAELCATSNYTFLTGASHPEELVTQAKVLGYHAIGLADLHTLAGVVRAHVAARHDDDEVDEAGTRFVLGSRIRPRDMPDLSLCLYPTDFDAYRRLCRLLTIGKRRTTKGTCELHWTDIEAHARGMLAIVDLEVTADASNMLSIMRVAFDDDRLSLAVRAQFSDDDEQQREARLAISRQIGIPLIATNSPHYHVPERRMLHDVLACIREGCTLNEAGFRLAANGERHLKSPEEMHRLFAWAPDAIERTIQIADRTHAMSLDLLRYEYPVDVVPPTRTAQEHLTELTWRGAETIYNGNIPEKVKHQIEHELALINELHYAPYFLTVHDLVRFARTGEEKPGIKPEQTWEPILCQGRGAAANSAVCFCIGVTAVDPSRAEMLFERFISRERNEPPDIDIDFEHERREEVIQYIYRTYGRERAALTAEVISYRRRSAVRDVGKALGLSLDLVDRLAKDMDWFDSGACEPERLRAMGINPHDTTMQWLAHLVGEILGFPRHLSQHVGGFVITRSPLCELVPIENAAMPERTVIEWDKDDIDAMGMLKVDVLGLGMLSALRRCLKMVNTRHGTSLSLATIPAEDPATYEMIQRADTVGVFQIESRAQMSMLPRLKPACFYDLVIEVAIVRPGPIQGNMVHPYLRRRTGEEKPEYAHPSIEHVLKRTLGVPLFQEQCMALAIHAAGFTPGEADQLRRAMAAWKRKGDQILRFGRKIIEGMTARGIAHEFAVRCFEQIKGFSEYGFPESHAASFALLVYASCWLKKHHPAEFCAAIINSQPMGFYAPAQLIRDAKEHGVCVREIDVNRSQWDCSIEHDGAIRLGMRLVGGLGAHDANRIAACVCEYGPQPDLRSLWRSSGVSARALRRLASADAYGSMGLSRQQALWQARLLRDEPMPLFDHLPEPHRMSGVDGYDALPSLPGERQVVLDYDATGLSLRQHPVSFARGELDAMGVVPCSMLADAQRLPDDASVRVAGLVLMRQRPGTASGVTFITLEDETGIANLVVWQQVYERFRRVLRSKMLIVSGRIQREGIVVHIVVKSARSGEGLLDGQASQLSTRPRNFR